MSIHGLSPWPEGYGIRDVATRTFFTLTAVIFDENSPYKPLHDTAPYSVPLDSGEPILELRKALVPSESSVSPHRTSCPIWLTAAGEAQVACVVSAKIHLEDIREAAHQRKEHAQHPNVNKIIASLADLKDNTLCATACPSSKAEDLIFSATSLSTDDKELALISIRSSEYRSP